MPNPSRTDWARRARAWLPVVLAAAAYPRAASADDLVLDATRTLVFSNAEDIALGGAGAAFSTGAPGAARSPASAANRREESTTPVTFGLLLLQARVSGPRDGWDVGDLGAPLDEQVRVFDLALCGGYRSVGVGLLTAGAYYRVDDAWLAISEGHASASVALLDGRLAVGAGPRLLGARVVQAGARGDYLGAGAEAGAVVSNVGDGWNFAVTGRSGVVARTPAGDVAGVGAVRLPPELVVGVGWTNVGVGPRVPVRLVADVVVDGSVPGAVAAESVLVGAPIPRGGALTVSPRAGAELDAWRDQLRLRGGGYWEPSRTALAGPRPHVTGGFELRLFRLHALDNRVNVDLAWQVGVDYAPRYFHGAWLGINLWQHGRTGGQVDGRAGGAD